MAKHRSHIIQKLHNNPSQVIAAIVVVIVAVIGVSLVLSSRAASPYATVQAASGTPAGVASIITSSGASSGKAVQFGTLGSRPPGLVQAGNSKTNCIYTNDVSTNLTAVEQLTGITFNCVGSFNGNTASWNSWMSPFDVTGFGFSQWVSANPTGRTIIFGMDMVPECPDASNTACVASPSTSYNDANPLTWETACAAGQYNAHATQLAQTLVANGWGYTVIRLGYEMNGPWAADFVGTTTAEQQAWGQCFQQEVTTMRAVSGAHFLFDFNPNTCYENIPLANFYPGNAYVDIIGADAYDSSCSTSLPPPPSAADWNTLYNETLGLNAIQAFATSQNKPMSIPEWGMQSGLGDDPFYVNGIGNYIKANNVAFQDYFDDGNDGILKLGTAYPNSLAAYKSQF